MGYNEYRVNRYEWLVYSLSDLFLLLLIVCLVLLTWRAIAVREFAHRAVKKHLDKLDLQLLDDNVAMKAVWIKRDPSGYLRFWRSYNFEFSSTGHERYKGRIILLGNQIENIVLEPYRLPDEQVEPNHHPQSGDTIIH